jgi:hypothetical protein
MGARCRPAQPVEPWPLARSLSPPTPRSRYTRDLALFAGLSSVLSADVKVKAALVFVGSLSKPFDRAKLR